MQSSNQAPIPYNWNESDETQHSNGTMVADPILCGSGIPGSFVAYLDRGRGEWTLLVLDCPGDAPESGSYVASFRAVSQVVDQGNASRHAREFELSNRCRARIAEISGSRHALRNETASAPILMALTWLLRDLKSEACPVDSAQAILDAVAEFQKDHAEFPETADKAKQAEWLAQAILGQETPEELEAPKMPDGWVAFVDRENPENVKSGFKGTGAYNGWTILGDGQFASGGARWGILDPNWKTVGKLTIPAGMNPCAMGSGFVQASKGGQ